MVCQLNGYLYMLHVKNKNTISPFKHAPKVTLMIMKNVFGKSIKCIFKTTPFYARSQKSLNQYHGLSIQENE